MTREEIKQVAENYASQMCNDCSSMLYCEDKNKKCIERREREKIFTDGVKWAEECLNLSLLWHPADEQPVGRDWKILIEDKSGCYWVEGKCSVYSFYDSWQNYVENFELTRWAYISNLLPKGGEE